MARSSMRRTTTVSGLRELEKALSDLPKAVAKGALRKTLMLAGQPVADAAIEKAPVRSGQLRDEIKVDSRKPKNFDKGKVAYREVLRTGGSREAAVAAMRTARRGSQQAFAEVFVGPSVNAPHAHFMEFGTADDPAQPYMRPAWDEKQDEALEIITTNLGDQIEKARQRHARRLARRTARGAR